MAPNAASTPLFQINTRVDQLGKSLSKETCDAMCLGLTGEDSSDVPLLDDLMLTSSESSDEETR